MKAPASLVDRPGRTALAVGASVVVSVGAVALVSGTTDADEPGHCTKNVDVHTEPDTTSHVVALCEADTEVQTDATRDGFVELTSLGGWEAQEHVSGNGQPPAPATPDRTATSMPAENDNDDDNDNNDNENADSRTASSGGSSGGSAGDSTDDDGNDSGDESSDDKGTDEENADAESTAGGDTSAGRQTSNLGVLGGLTDLIS
jgi:hypothetical protein